MAELGFSPWIDWNRRASVPAASGPGVYLLGRFEEGAPEAVDQSDRNIILIAETHGQALLKRWYQFERSATRGADGHSPGQTFHRLFANGTDSSLPAWLYVTACGVPDGNDPATFVNDLKSRLLTQYEQTYGSLPRCNTNGPAGPTTSALSTEIDSSDSRPSEAVVEPEREFSPWKKWEARDQLNGKDYAGIYVLARFSSPPTDEADPLNDHVVYIGETCENSLSGRLYQFNRSAFFAKAGHSGGWAYRERMGTAWDGLYVTVFPIRNLAEPHRSAFIRRMERQLLWEYVKRWGRRPLCNSK